MKEETNYCDSRTEEEREQDSKIEATTTYTSALVLTPQQILQEFQEEFQKKFPTLDMMETRALMNGETPRKNSGWLSSDIKSFFISTLQAFIESEIARLEGMSKNEWLRVEALNLDSELYVKQYEIACRKDEVIRDQVSHYQELLVTNK